MFLKSGLFRVVCAFCLALTLSAATFADTIRLKDGSIIKGKIVSFGGGKFTVKVGARQINYSAAEVESITFDGDSMPATNIKTSADTSPNTDKGSTVITVGQNTKPISSPTISPRVNTNPTTLPPKPIEINVKVLADNSSNGWSNSGWVVRKGQKIKIIGSGSVSLGGGRYTTANGIASLSDKDKLMAQESTGGLIAVIGDNNNEFIFIGDSKEFTATRDGALFLGVNEGNLSDNSGVFDVKIEISPQS
ncbi:MAG: hypothetical protein LH614_02260 [Pyrinomonadaceae bacterium]|nr:hypothetical protein [Pyrinomonadaceae bacterium]